MERFNNPNPSTLLGVKKETPLHADYLTAILVALAKLERHYRRSLDELEKQTYIDRLRDLTPEQVQRFTDELLDTLKRMPVVADFKELANKRTEDPIPDSRPPRDYPIPPLMEEIREIEREISHEMFGKPYHELAGDELLACSTRAAQVRYERMLGRKSA